MASKAWALAWEATRDERTLALARERYVDGTFDVEDFEDVVDAVLRGRPVVVLQPGEIIIPMGGNVRDLRDASEANRRHTA